MKYRNILVEQLKSQPYFEKLAIVQLGEQYDIKGTTLDTYISLAIRRKEILLLRRGVYVTAEYFNSHRSHTSYFFYLANIIRRPSYVSSWTALQYYNLTTEVIHSVTSATKKVTREYRSKAGDFLYHSIQPKLFSGFVLEKREFEFYIATPAKALFDLLYFRTLHKPLVKPRDIDAMVDSLRIDIDEMSDSERQKFDTLVETYVRNK